ncbi:Lipopolysaccharide export system permease protein LptG [Pseudoruegeria aquimaris]|uniref:Lipopolysaccharide export system permease protein LptG n=1 Tax=Pseudoruegeria aquimaris TaxID=393663 RepID=A0A1Y5R7T9_9RHOB|nr:LPS export ABC transporter permease LptG [Pseudoruegeria aquimaris]SLN11139.1 Lipopolysaccharide export system permease protein LptG [Pseudoruegeria aquimaris]
MILHLYFARRFMRYVLIVGFAFTVLMQMFDMVEQLRKFGGKDVPFGEIFELSLLRLPAGLYQILPLIVILATLALYLSLARSSELVVTRAAGRSAVVSLISPVIAALLLGCFSVAVLNPIVAGTQKRYELLENSYRSGERSVLSISNEGLWLRQGNSEGQTVIRAAESNLDGTLLRGVTFISFDTDGTPKERIEAEEAALSAGRWALQNAKVWSLSTTDNPERDARTYETLDLASNLTRQQIRDSFGTPSAIPIWDLPRFINSLKNAGFSPRQHQVWFHMELASPLFLAAMVLIGAAFTMRHTRFGRTGIMVLAAILMGFGLFFIRNFAQVLGESGQIPIGVAAWTPPVAGICLALGLILHLEDG